MPKISKPVQTKSTPSSPSSSHKTTVKAHLISLAGITRPVINPLQRANFVKKSLRKTNPLHYPARSRAPAHDLVRARDRHAPPNKAMGPRSDCVSFNYFLYWRIKSSLSSEAYGIWAFYKSDDGVYSEAYSLTWTSLRVVVCGGRSTWGIIFGFCFFCLCAC